MGSGTTTGDDVLLRVRTRAIGWFAVVVFAYYYKALFCGLLGHGLGIDVFCATGLRGITSNHWVEIAVYCPLMWFALHQVNADVFGDVPTDPVARRRHRRLQTIGEFAIAMWVYGAGIHIANVAEIYSRDELAVTDGELYDLIYFLDEGLSHYVQFVPLFFVLGWFVLHDRPGRTTASMFAVFVGVAHGVERAVGILEGGKWFLGPVTVVWFAVVVWLRRRRNGAGVADEFFARYAAAFCISHPLSLIAYYAWIGSFDQPSALPDAELWQVAAGAIVVTVGGTAVLGTAGRRLGSSSG